jgi:hypothetical protein
VLAFAGRILPLLPLQAVGRCSSSRDSESVTTQIFIVSVSTQGIDLDLIRRICLFPLLEPTARGDEDARPPRAAAGSIAGDASDLAAIFVAAIARVCAVLDVDHTGLLLAITGIAWAAAFLGFAAACSVAFWTPRRY